MSRGIKKIIYGLFYLAILAGVVFLVYVSFIKPAPTCFDQIKNQGEEDIDCGGPCLPCAIAHLKPLQASQVQIFKIGNGPVEFLAEVTNSNPDYGASSFSYQFDLYNQKHRFLTSITGSSFIYNSEKKYLLEVSSSAVAQEAATAEIKISQPVWKSKEEFIKPLINVSAKDTFIDPNGIEVSGQLTNNSLYPAKDLRILVLLKNKWGMKIFASQTYLPQIDSLGSDNFLVLFPNDPFLTQNTDPSATEIFVSAKQ